MLETYPASPHTPVTPLPSVRRTSAFLTLLAAVFLASFCASGFYLALSYPQFSLSTAPAQLLVKLPLLQCLQVAVGGWVADMFWGARRTILVGATLLVSSYMGLALVVSAVPGSLPPSGADLLTQYALLAAQSLGAGLLIPGLLVAAARMQAPGSTRVFTTFLVVRLVMGLAAAAAPFVIGILLDGYTSTWLLLSYCLAAILLLALGLWGAWPSVGRFEPSGGAQFARPVGLLLVALGAGIAGLAMAREWFEWSVVIECAAGLGYVWWRSRRVSTLQLPLMVLGTGAALFMVDVAVELGFGPGNTTGAAMAWRVGPLAVLLPLIGWAQRRGANADAASQRLWRANWLLVGSGVAVVALRMWPAFGPQAAVLPGVPAALPLHIGSTGLFFLLPVLISQRAEPHLVARYMALSLLLGEAVYTLAIELASHFRC